MKKAVSIILILLVLLSFTLVSKAATENRIYSPDVRAERGSTVEIPLCIENNSGFMGFDIIVEYSSDILTPVSVSKSSLLTGMFDDSIETSDPGSFHVIYTGSENIISDGQLFTVKFNVSESAFADTAVSLSYSQEDTFDESFNDVILNCENITVSFDGGTIEPSEELKLSERIQKWAAELPSPWNTIMSILTAPVVFIISIFER